jgi:hypothetical protein
MSLEDEFHNTYHLDKKTLVLRCSTNNHFIKKLKDNISSDKTNEILSLINDNKFNNFTSKDILLDKHPLFKLDIKDNILDLHINHCYIGGNILVRLIENILDAKPRYIPESNLLYGLLYGCYNIKNIFKFLRKENNIECKHELSHYSKSFTIYKSPQCSRLTWAYYTLFQDILKLLNKDSITVGIPIPFKKNNISNNIGIIIFEYNKINTPKMTENILQENVNLAYTTNTFQLYGKQLSKIMKLNNYSSRKKIDIICSTFITDNTSIPGNFCLLPKVEIIETMYISMFIRLLGDKQRAHIYTGITTNSKLDFEKLKYINNPL